MSKVIFPPEDYWTHPPKENTVADNPAAINRRLTDPERALLAELTVWVTAEQTGVTNDEAARALERLNNDVGIRMEGDNIDVNVTCNGHTILHCTREWLAYWAHTDEELTIDELRRCLQYYRGSEDQ